MSLMKMGRPSRDIAHARMSHGDRVMVKDSADVPFNIRLRHVDGISIVPMAGRS